MKWKLLIPILLMSIIGICYGENITVELLPNSMEVDVGNTLNIDLVIKNIPENGKCGGFETKIYYDANILNLNNIKLSDIGERATLKNVNLSSEYVSLAWFSNLPYNNLTLVTVSFKVLNPGETNITLKDMVLSNENGYAYKDISIHPATVKALIKPNLNITNLSIGTPIYMVSTPINVTLTNNGHEDINKSFSMDLYAGAKKIGSITVDGLDIGESKTLTFNWTPEDVKICTLVAVVDPENIVSEEKEDDNKVIKTVKVIPTTPYVKLYKISQDKNTIKTIVDVSNIPEERPVGGYDLYIRLKNLSVKEINPTGTHCWNLFNDILYISGFNISKSGKFSIVNISFSIVDKTYSLMLDKIVLSDINGYPFKEVILENEIPLAEDIKSEKIRNFLSKSKLILGSEADANLSAKYLKTYVLIKRPLRIEEDCILVGGPVANPVVNKYHWAFPVKVTNDYPGKHKGVIQKQIINGHTVILLAGSDKWGTKAAVEYFKTLEDIPDEPIFVEWRDGKIVKDK